MDVLGTVELLNRQKFHGLFEKGKYLSCFILFYIMLLATKNRKCQVI